MRFTIERIRTLVLIAAVLLLAALAVFLARAKFKNVLSRRDLPQRLGLNITEESNGYSYSHNLGAHSKFRIHASKAIQLKNDRIELHGVEIEIFGADGIQSDKIAGDEFEYDQKSGIASAQGPVEMMLSRPAAAKTSDIRKTDRSHTTAAAASQASQIQVKTSGVSFDRNTGVVTTTQRVDFSTTQGTGSAVGASFDSQNGYLRLMQSVELSTYRGADPVKIHADHAEFDRDAQLCLLNTATLAYRGGEAEAAQARILFRDDGSAARLDATGGFTLTTATGGRLASPRAAMEFSEKNQLRHGHLEGGVTFDSKQEGGSAKEGRTIDGTSPTAELDFSTEGQLRHAHLERGVTMQSDETSLDSAGQTLRVARTWRSPVADLDFHSVQSGGKTQLEAQSIHGTGGVTITSDSQRGDTAAVPAKMQADEMTGTFGAESVLRTIAGTGHAVMEQTTAAGAHQIASGERLAVVLSPPHGAVGTKTLSRTQSAADPDVQSAELDGHVVLFEQPAPKPGTQTQPPLRAAAGKAVYEGAGEWLHLTANPRIVNGGLELTAEKVDLSRQSGDAFAHNNVKATWLGETPNGGSPNGNSNQSGALQGISALGGNGPAHVIANEAQLNESTGEATFRGHARLWQQANSVAGPEIVLNQHLQTLVARTADANDPVRAVLLSAGAPGAGSAHGQAATENTAAGTTAPSVIRIRGGDLWYSGAEHRAVMHGGVAGAVTAETGTAMSTSDTVELRLIPAGNHDASTSQAQVDRMTASGHVVLVSRGRRGTGGQLVYSGVTGDYVLTGTRAAPPRMTDPEQGNVTGEALIFHSRDDSVSIEGGGQDTRTETTAPREHAR